MMGADAVRAYGGPWSVLAAIAGVAVILDVGRFLPTIARMARPRWGWPKPSTRPDHMNHVYGRYLGQELSLDIYLPRSGSSHQMPLVIFFHGGGWMLGDKKLIEPGVFRLLDHGFAVASVDYALSSEAVWPEQGLQIKGAVRWLRAHATEFGFDPDAFFAFGGSAGGHLAAMLATTNGVARFEDARYGNMDVSSAIQRAVLWYAPTDLLLRARFSLLRLVFFDGHPRSPLSACAKLIGGAPARRRDIARDASPVHWARADTTVPCLLTHGTKDVVVPYEHSVAFAAKLDAIGVDHRFTVFDRYRHVDRRFNQAATMDDVIEFLRGDSPCSNARTSSSK